MDHHPTTNAKYAHETPRRWPLAAAMAAALAASLLVTPTDAMARDDLAPHKGSATDRLGAVPDDPIRCFVDTSEHDAAARTCTTADAIAGSLAYQLRDCPPKGSIRDVGVPWVAPERTGCDSIDYWWRYVPHGSR